MHDQTLPLMQGTLDLLVLHALSDEARHGYGVSEWLRERTDGTLRVEEGALYTCLHRMEGRGWLAPHWGISENKRRAKYYQLTDVGLRQLDIEARRFRRYADAVFQVLGPTPATETS